MSATARRKARTRNFQQEVFLSEANAPPKVDRANGVIHGVKILGHQSRNEGGQREYSDDALADTPNLYEGCHVNFDHPAPHEARRDRTFDEAGGVLRNVHLGHDGEPYGDLHLLTSDPKAQKLMEAAEKMPDRFGLSHNADGDIVRTPDGRSVIKKITRVRSVDVVHKPATNKSLFESHSQHHRGTTMKTIKLSALLESEPELKESLTKSFKEGYETEGPSADTGAGGADDMASADVSVPDDMGAGDGDGDDHGLILALLQFVMKFLGKATATQERMRESMVGMKKCMESKFGPDVIQGFVPDMTAGEYQKSADSKDGGAKGVGLPAQEKMPYQESIRLAIDAATKPLLEALNELKKDKVDSLAKTERAECVTLIESENREADDVIVSAVLSVKGREERVKLIRRFPEKARAKFGERPAVSIPALLESEAPASLPVPKTSEDFVRAVTGRQRARVGS